LRRQCHRTTSKSFAEGGLPSSISSIPSAAESPEVKGVVIDAEAVPFIDVTAVQMLSSLREELDERGVRLVIARDVGQIRDVIESTDAAEGLKHLYPTVQSAVEAPTEKPG
jgi:SulP family sulfate permease